MDSVARRVTWRAAEGVLWWGPPHTQLHPCWANAVLQLLWDQRAQLRLGAPDAAAAIVAPDGDGGPQPDPGTYFSAKKKKVHSLARAEPVECTCLRYGAGAGAAQARAHPDTWVLALDAGESPEFLKGLQDLAEATTQWSGTLAKPMPPSRSAQRCSCSRSFCIACRWTAVPWPGATGWWGGGAHLLASCSLKRLALLLAEGSLRSLGRLAWADHAAAVAAPDCRCLDVL
jgi:hypothetical protein